jgi:hypothetical protein
MKTGDRAPGFPIRCHLVRVAPFTTAAHEARAGDPGFGAYLHTHLYPDLTVGAKLFAPAALWAIL